MLVLVLLLLFELCQHLLVSLSAWGHENVGFRRRNVGASEAGLFVVVAVVVVVRL